MNSSECIYGNSMKFRIDQYIKKREYRVNDDWNPNDFLFGVYEDKEKQGRIKNENK